MILFRHLRRLVFLSLLVSVILSVIAVYLYPGGDLENLNAQSFSFSKNYICHLFNPIALNESPNQGYILAIGGAFSLAISFLLTLYLAPYYLNMNSVARKWVQIPGILSMSGAGFIYTSYHDSVIFISGIFGNISLGIIFYNLFVQKRFKLLLIGFTGVAMCAFTYFIYYSHYFFDWLPIFQKLSLFTLVGWMLLFHISFEKTRTLKSRG